VKKVTDESRGDGERGGVEMQQEGVFSKHPKQKLECWWEETIVNNDG
jgi:hypothetical protein